MNNSKYFSTIHKQTVVTLTWTVLETPYWNSIGTKMRSILALHYYLTHDENIKHCIHNVSLNRMHSVRMIY